MPQLEDRRRKQDVVLPGSAECPNQEIDSLAATSCYQHVVGRNSVVCGHLFGKHRRSQGRITIETCGRAIADGYRSFVGIQSDGVAR
jgi:hypothetical protein